MHNQWHIKLIGGQAQRCFLSIADDEHAREAVVDLPRRLAMRMRMKPIRACSINHLKFIGVALTRRNGKARVTVHVLGQHQAMPMNHRGVVFARQTVGEVDAHLLPLFHAYHRAKRAVGQRHCAFG